MADPTYTLTPRTDPEPDADVWVLAREDFRRGASPPLIAERRGLHVRTLQRRAAAEGWREAPVPESPVSRSPLAVLDRVLGRLNADAELERRPELRPFVEAHSYEVDQLLLHPRPIC